MSVSGEEISSVEISKNGDGDDEDEQGHDHGERNDGFGCGYSRNFRKAKRVVFFPFAKAKKSLLRATNVGKSSPSAITRSSGKMVGGDGSIKGCHFCFMQPRTLESPPGSETTDPNDPNDPNFTFDMLRDLLEKNDFYSKECNPHIDVSGSRD